MTLAPAATMTVSVAMARRRASRMFEAAGFERPDIEARVLVAHALGLDHAGLAAHADRALSAEEAACVERSVSRRLAHEPAAYIVGMKEFWGLPITVTPAVLIPRPDTETLVEAALAVVDARGWRGHPLRIADLCTGSGALLLALLSELPNATGVGTDCSVAALAVATMNAARLGLSDGALFVVCDFGAALCGGFDLVVANPPYVETHVIATLAPEVRDREPRIALDGGADGLSAYRAIAGDAPRLLALRGQLLMEIGLDQQCAVERLLRVGGADVRPAVVDLSGIPRVVSSSW